jgi:protease YdgD
MVRATRPCGAIVIAAILCVQMARAGEPSAEAVDHRAAVDATSYPWSAVGALFNGGRSECTAVAIAPDQALTAAHCLFGQATGRLMQPQSLHLLLGFVRGTYQVDALVQSYQFGVGYDHERPYDTLDADWALLKLTAPLPADHPALALANALPDTGAPVMTGGYGKDRAFMMTVDTRCRVRQVVRQAMVLLNDCRTVHGYSGSPLLQPVVGTDRLEVVGLNVAISTVDGVPVTLSVPAVTIVRELGMPIE